MLNTKSFMCPLINLILYILVFIHFKHYSFWHLCIFFFIHYGCYMFWNYLFCRTPGYGTANLSHAQQKPTEVGLAQGMLGLVRRGIGLRVFLD